MAASLPNFELVALDLDRTLLDSSGRLPDRNRAALHEAHERGMKVVVCTGRTFTETRPVLAAIGLDLDAAVTIGGGLISDATSGRTLRSTSFSRALAEEMVAWFQAHEHTVMWTHDPAEHGFDGYMLTGRRHHPALDRWREMTPCEIRIREGLPGEAPIRLTVIDEPESLAEIGRGFVEAFGSRVTHHLIHVPTYDFMVLETFTGQVSKWSAIDQLCRDWRIDPRATLAFGDDVNDIALLAGAGHGVAVANAHPDVIAVANEVTDSNDDCGVARILERVLADRVSN